MSAGAYQIIGEPELGGPFVFTCEHASKHLPEWEPGPEDRPFLEDHWGWDIGAADLTRALVALTGSCAVLSQFSRLVCDPNRDPDEASFVIEAIDGTPLAFNRDVDTGERKRRRARYFDPYHEAIDRTVAARLRVGPAPQLCAVHSFTPLYRGERRLLEIGVLFDRHEPRARELAAALGREGFETALNQPYSGHEGLIYPAAHHGGAHGLIYFELEVRQDLIATPSAARSVARRMARALGAPTEG